MSEEVSFSERKELNRQKEDAVVAKLTNGEPVFVYHKLQNPEDLDGVNSKGYLGNFPVNTVKGELRRVYFGLLPPEQPEDTFVKVELNTKGQRLRIYDGKLDEKPASIPQLVQEGFDGYVVKGAAYIPLDRNYMLCVFDGQRLKNRSSKLNN